MTPERESPQEKKRRDLSERVSGGNRRNAEARKKEKKNVGRKTRSKADELLAQVKPQLSADDTEAVAGELTAAHLRKSVNRTRIRKDGAAPFREIIERQRERRRQSFGRKTRAHPHYDKRAAEALDALKALNEKQFINVARRAGKLCSPEFRHKYIASISAGDPIDCALNFLQRLSWGSGEENQALSRNKDLGKAFTAWIKKANRVLAKDRLAARKKHEAHQAAKAKHRRSDNE